MNGKGFEIIDNNDGTVTKRVARDNGEYDEYKYQILVGGKIPEGESVTDYCYFQHEASLVTELRDAKVNEWSFCSGTCVAMLLGIEYGDSSITPTDVLYWGENSTDEEKKLEVNWTWETDENGNYLLNENGNRKDIGLKAWEREGYSNDDRQVYDNSGKGENGNFGALDGSDIKNDRQYLKEVKTYLSEGQPVIIHVKYPGSDGHFVVAVGVEDGIGLDEAAYDQLVIFDPGTDKAKMVTTIGDARYDYKIKDYRIITAYPIDSEKKFVYDENGVKAHDPYYVNPLKTEDGSIVPADRGRAIKNAIEFIENSADMTDSEKDNAVKAIIRTIMGNADIVYKEFLIEENGVYEPEVGVKWDKVTVDVPQSGDIIDKITELPVICRGSIGSKYHYNVHYGNAAGGTPVPVNSYSSNNSGGETKYYAAYKKEPTGAWFVLLDNAGSKVIYACALGNSVDYGSFIGTNNLYSKCCEYSTRAADGGINGGYTEYEPFLYALHTAEVTSAEAKFTKYAYSRFGLKVTIEFSVTSSYYKAYLNSPQSGEEYRTALPETVNNVSQRTVTVNFNEIYLPINGDIPLASFSRLSSTELADEMVKLVYSINEN